MCFVKWTADEKNAKSITWTAIFQAQVFFGNLYIILTETLGPMFLILLFFKNFICNV